MRELPNRDSGAVGWRDPQLVENHHAPADIHCYTPPEFERKREQLPAVRDAAEHGLELLPEPTG